MFGLLGRKPCHLVEPEFVLTFCRTLLCLLALAYSSSSISVPVSASCNPSISCTKSGSPLVYQLFLPNHDLPGDVCPIIPFFDKHFGPKHFPGIFMYLLPLPHLMHRYLLASARHAVRCFVLSLLLSTFGNLSSSQSFHSSTKQ